MDKKKDVQDSDTTRNKGVGVSENDVESKPTAETALHQCLEKLSRFGNAWKTLQDTGSDLIKSLGNQFKVSSNNDKFGTEMCQLLQDVADDSDMKEKFWGKLKEINSLLQSLQKGSGQPDKQGEFAGVGDSKNLGDFQVIFRCILLLLKMEADYHQICSKSLWSLVETLALVCEKHGNIDIIKQMKSLELNFSPHQSPTRNVATKGSLNSLSGSPKLASKHGNFKTTLFSFFDRKSSPSQESRSSFYVDLPPQGDNQEILNDQNMQESKTDGVLIQLGLDPDTNLDHLSPVTIMSMPEVKVTAPLAAESDGIGKQKEEKNHLATKEELDSVINLLSGVSISSISPMQTIPEHQDDPISLYVLPPSAVGSLSPSPSDSGIDMKTSRMQTQRRSEGSLDLSWYTKVGHNHGNTWPDQHRSNPSGRHMNQNIFFDFGVSSLPRKFSNDVKLCPLGTMMPPGAGTSHYTAGTNWGLGDPKLHRAWPVSNLTAAGSDMLNNSSWSACAVDSDDLSDDSSSGDQLSAVGLDLVQAINSKWDDISASGDSNASPRKSLSGETVRHHSMEDLLDSKSTNTWPPPKQLWGKPSPIQSEDLPNQSTNLGAFHRPIQMQWSDPLSSPSFWLNPDISTVKDQYTDPCSKN
ncbi:hypothetical protein CHS0354_009412 [Potamilus streckersoni]|uniref:Uncharacterized protein n=1 Tax=Potamilus streckersoni TaxID=2493646 RepID=A0AAE0T470_9BIVA|nr:hypothetical protein CHS0354_009412 [Potamilus streckersoni]